MSDIDLDSMSDEDIMNLMSAPEVAPGAGAVTEPEVDDDLVGEAEVDDPAEAPSAAGEDGDQPADPEAEDPADEDLGDAPPAAKPAAEAPATEAADGAPQTPVTAGAPEAVNYEELYRKIMAPFRANGREFKPESPDEAVQLMQLGANYTKKMQGLKPHLKMIRMLEANGLLQEDKISFLIDLDKKNPQAIQKLLHDGKVDPLDLDTTSAPTYKPSNYSVSDQDMRFQDAIASVRQSPTGTATIREINDNWDAASKEAIYSEPEVLEVLDQQRSNGIYAKITAEIERRRVLGQLINVPFIQAYKTVGDELHQAGRLLPEGTVPAAPAPAPAASQPQPVDTRPARTRVPTATRDQVRAISAAPGSTTKATPRQALDPFTMTDEQIMAIPTKF